MLSGKLGKQQCWKRLLGGQNTGHEFVKWHSSGK